MPAGVHFVGLIRSPARKKRAWLPDRISFLWGRAASSLRRRRRTPRRLNRFEQCGRKPARWCSRWMPICMTEFWVVSHLPHVAAFALINALADIRDQQIPSLDLASHSGGGLRDTTRIAASSPEMWRDIFLWNRDNVVAFIEAYERSLSQLKQLIEWAMPQASRRSLSEPGRNERNSQRDQRCPRSRPMTSLTITPGRPLQERFPSPAISPSPIAPSS